MKLAIRTSKSETSKVQLLTLLNLEEEDIQIERTLYKGVTLFSIEKISISEINSIRYIDAVWLDEASAAELLHPRSKSEAASFKSLDLVDEREQYDHLNQLLHIQKTTRDKR